MKKLFNLNLEDVNKFIAMILIPQVKKKCLDWLDESNGFKLIPMISELKFLNLKVSLILRNSLIGYIMLKESLSIEIFLMIRRSS